MRMRRKKNLDERLLACGDILYMPLEEDRDFRADCSSQIGRAHV